MALPAEERLTCIRGISKRITTVSRDGESVDVSSECHRPRQVLLHFGIFGSHQQSMSISPSILTFEANEYLSYLCFIAYRIFGVEYSGLQIMSENFPV